MKTTLQGKGTDKNEKRREILYKYVKDHYWKVSRAGSNTLSVTCRQLALGEGGLCWLIKSSATCDQLVSQQINFILILLVFFFIFDAVQYLITTVRYHALAEDYDKDIKEDRKTKLTQLEEPQGINSPITICYSFKLCILALASFFLISLMMKI